MAGAAELAWAGIAVGAGGGRALQSRFVAPVVGLGGLTVSQPAGPVLSPACPVTMEPHAHDIPTVTLGDYLP